MDLFAPQPELITLRSYQRAAIDAVYAHLRTRDDNPCVVLPTGAGKAIVLAQICTDAVQLWSGRVLVIAHVKELLEQAADKIARLAPTLSIGVHSAGMRRRDTQHAVIVAGIQSIYRKACDIGPVDLVVIDECHLIPPDGDGMYRQFLADMKVINPQVRVIGLTATPFRLKSGSICTPEGYLNHICFEIGVRELIVRGYLSPLRTKAGKYKANLDAVHVRGGEFIADELEAAMDQDSLVYSACSEIVDYTLDRKSCLIFASSIQHAKHIQQTIESMAKCECGMVDGQTASLFRDQLLRRFKAGELKYLCNVNVLTTGFDAPNVDCVALLRPTMSPGLYYQMVGRGFRLAPGKADCLVLDFGGNVVRHGPVDQLRVEETLARGSGEAPAKECPTCHALIAAGYASCPECGHAFPPPERNKHEAHASGAGVLSGEITLTDYPVTSVHYSVHEKRGAAADAPKSMRVDYRIGMYQYKSEWVCFEHEGYARQKAELWWSRRSDIPVPATAAEAVELAQSGALAETTQITVREVSGEKYDRIVDYQLGAKPEASDPQDIQQVAAEPEYVPADDDIPF